MATDGPRKRSIEISHRHLAELHFRAYALDLVRHMEASKDYNLLPAHSEQAAIIRDQRPAAEWSADLPATPDYESHRTFVTPAMKNPGTYLIAASAARDFSQSPGNRIVTAFLNVSDIVLFSTRRDSASIEVRVLEGQSGRPVSGAEAHPAATQASNRPTCGGTRGDLLVQGGRDWWEKAPQSQTTFAILDGGAVTLGPGELAVTVRPTEIVAWRADASPPPRANAHP